MEKSHKNRLRITIEYQRVLPDGALDISIEADLREINLVFMNFISYQKLDIETSLKISIPLSENDRVVFSAKVIKINKNALDEFYTIGASIEDNEHEVIFKLKEFLFMTDISNVLDELNLDNVVDINFVAGYPPIIKKFGSLTEHPFATLDEFMLRTMLLSALDDDRFSQFTREKDLNIIYTSKKGIRFRANYHLQRGKVEATFRYIQTSIMSPTGLGLPKTVENMLVNRQGLILVSGTTGSGKSTTLAGMIEYLNRRKSGIIVSIEDPIEYIHTNQKCIIKSREIGRDTLSFYAAAKSALRQNPDVLMIGEILDAETMETAITAAETGVLVLTSIHAGNVAQTLDRVASMFPADSQKHYLKRLSLVLKGVIYQELIPSKDGMKLVLASEILVANHAVKQIVRESKWEHLSTAIQLNKAAGMQSKADSLRKLFEDGLISEEYLTE